MDPYISSSASSSAYSLTIQQDMDHLRWFPSSPSTSSTTSLASPSIRKSRDVLLLNDSELTNHLRNLSLDIPTHHHQTHLPHRRRRHLHHDHSPSTSSLPSPYLSPYLSPYPSSGPRRSPRHSHNRSSSTTSTASTTSTTTSSPFATPSRRPRSARRARYREPTPFPTRESTGEPSMQAFIAGVSDFTVTLPLPVTPPISPRQSPRDETTTTPAGSPYTRQLRPRKFGESQSQSQIQKRVRIGLECAAVHYSTALRPD